DIAHEASSISGRGLGSSEKLQTPCRSLRRLKKGPSRDRRLLRRDGRVTDLGTVPSAGVERRGDARDVGPERRERSVGAEADDEDDDDTLEHDRANPRAEAPLAHDSRECTFQATAREGQIRERT